MCVGFAARSTDAQCNTLGTLPDLTQIFRGLTLITLGLDFRKGENKSNQTSLDIYVMGECISDNEGSIVYELKTRSNILLHFFFQ